MNVPDLWRHVTSLDSHTAIHDQADMNGAASKGLGLVEKAHAKRSVILSIDAIAWTIQCSRTEWECPWSLA